MAQGVFLKIERGAFLICPACVWRMAASSKCALTIEHLWFDALADILHRAGLGRAEQDERHQTDYQFDVRSTVHSDGTVLHAYGCQ